MYKLLFMENDIDDYSNFYSTVGLQSILRYFKMFAYLSYKLATGYP